MSAPPVIPTGFMWEAIESCLPARARRSATGFFNINCPLPGCGDRHWRCGVRPSSDGAVVVSCYNCDFKAGWTPGYGLSQKLRSFLKALGLADIAICNLAVDAGRCSSLMSRDPILRASHPGLAAPSFDTVALPTGARSIRGLLEEGYTDPDLAAVVDYLKGRGDDIYDSFDFHWTSSTDHGLNRRALIPNMHQGRTIGWSARAIDTDLKPRYYSSMSAGALFNTHALTNPKRKIVILVEGVFDAIAIDSLGMMGAHLSSAQIGWINSYRKKVILVPDRDARGLKMIDTALEQGWHVAFPWGEFWDHKIKDTAEATRVYGSLWALTGIIDTAADNPVRIAAHRLRLE